eukprot:g559.t1
MVPALTYYNRHLKELGKDWLFPLEEVVLQPGDASDDISEEGVKEVTRTGRFRLQKYWLLHTDKVMSEKPASLQHIDAQKAQQAKADAKLWNNKRTTLLQYFSHKLRMLCCSKKINDARKTEVGTSKVGCNPGDVVRVIKLSKRGTYVVEQAGEKRQATAEGESRSETQEKEEHSNTQSQGSVKKIKIRRVYRMRQPAWLLAAFLSRVVMAPAALLSFLQHGLTALRHRGVNWWERNYDYVTSPTVAQFVRDNPKVKVLHLGGSKNLKASALGTVGEHCKHLTKLFVNDCALSALPSTISNLKALTTLFLGANALTALPRTMSQLKALTKLYVGDNKLPSTEVDFIIESFPQLTELSLYKLGLTALPSTIGNLKALTYLGLAVNRLTVIPSTIGDLKALTKLSLERNALTALPSTIGELQALTFLNLRDNKIAGTLPRTMSQLTALKELFVGDNKLPSTEVEFIIESFPQLTKLYLNDLGLTDSIGKLQALKELYLQSNSLSDAEKARVKAALPNCSTYF